MCFHPSLSDEPTIDVTPHTVSDDRLEPHKYQTEETSENTAVHGCEKESIIGYIFSHTLEYLAYSDRLSSCHRTDMFSEEEETIDGKTREKKPDAPCKSFLYCTDPYGCAIFSPQSDDAPEERISRSYKNLEHEVTPHDIDKYEGNGKLSLERDKKE